MIEEPNDWERRIHEDTRKITGTSEVGLKRRAFWSSFIDTYPEDGAEYPADAASSRWRTIEGLSLKVVQFVAKDCVGIFVRPERGESGDGAFEILSPFQQTLERNLDTDFGPNRNNHFLVKRYSCDTDNQENWPNAFDWLKTETDRYLGLLGKLGL